MVEATDCCITSVNQGYSCIKCVKNPFIRLNGLRDFIQRFHCIMSQTHFDLMSTHNLNNKSLLFFLDFVQLNHKLKRFECKEIFICCFQ